MKTKKNNKRLVLFLGIILLIVILGTILYLIFNKEEENYNLSSNEKKWIENNKNKVIDISITNNIPIFSLDGKGIVLTFIDYFEQSTSLEFNKSTCCSDTNAEYSFKIINESKELADNQYLLYKDNYVLLGKSKDIISNLNLLSERKIGVLRDNLDEISNYLETDTTLTFVASEDYFGMLSKFESGELDYIVVPKNQYLEKIITNEYFIVYNLSALNDSYVLELNGSKELNSILTKKLKEWSNINLNKMFIKEMNEYYFKLSEIDEKKASDFKSRVYIYGYVDNLPYDIEKGNEHHGINSEFMKGFEAFSGAKINYKRYKDIDSLEDAFNKKNVDIIFNYFNLDDSINMNNTIPIYSSNYVILSHINNNVTIDSFASLKGNTIYTIKDTKLANYFNKNSGAEIKTYSRVNNMLKNKEPLILLDLNLYNFYKNSKLKDYYIIYEGVADIKYNFGVNKDEINDTFSQIFEFYLMNSNHKGVINEGMTKLLKSNFLTEISDTQYILVASVLLLSILLLLKKGKMKKNVKEGNIKYIDSLTSLKNRNYLIDNIEKWDDTKLLPKTVIIIDLNRLKDVNNNFGYKEGDRLIKAAANILINNQIENSDIIRTDGNEFMVYTIGHEKNAIVDYTKKLQKLFKDLPYEHGATLGYSMINDDIKEVEDAINDATLDMLTNKENRELDA